jgi:hypothetical protein
VDSAEQAAARLRLALDLYQAGEELMRQKLRREHPEATGDAIERLLDEWLATRPGAERHREAGNVAPQRPLIRLAAVLDVALQP